MSSEDLIREASDPATAPARLAELASADRATWPALAGNPSTYEGLLGWLGERDDPAVNAALAARAQATLPPVPPPAPPAAPVEAQPVEATQPIEAQPVEATQPIEAPAETPTVVAPAAPTFSAPAQPEPTAIFQTPGAPEPVAAYPAAPATDPAPGGDSGTSGKNLAIVVAMVAVVLALIAGAAYGATQVFGDDDVDVSSPAATKTSQAPADDEDEDLPSIAPPSVGSDDDLPEASSEFCSTMKDVQTASEDLIDGVGSSPDLDEIKEMGEDMADSYAKLAESAPAELKADVEVMGSYFELMTNPTADSASKMSESISDYADSAQKVTTYYAQNCF